MQKEMLTNVLNAQKNIIVEGDISTGKTSGFMLPIVNEIIQNNKNLLILDSKEEYINSYYNDLKDNNYNIKIINLKDATKSEGWNPLSYPYVLYKKGDIDKAIEYLYVIAQNIFVSQDEVDPFWSTSASDLFMGISLALFEDAVEDEINFESIIELINTKDYNLLKTYFDNKDNTSSSYRFASTTINAPTETRGGILSVARQKLRMFVVQKQISNLLYKTTFDIKEISKEKIAIIIINNDYKSFNNNLASMFIEEFYTMLKDINNQNEFAFILDNYDTLEKFDNIVNILSSCLSNNIKLYIATRSIEEMFKKDKDYIKKLANIFNINDIEDNKSIEVINKKTVIDYNKLNIWNKKIFNLEKYLNNKGIYNNNKTIQNIIDKIDEKISSIEENQ